MIRIVRAFVRKGKEEVEEQKEEEEEDEKEEEEEVDVANMREEYSWFKSNSLHIDVLQKQIEALKDLCTKAGITDADIAACTPKRELHALLLQLTSHPSISLCTLSTIAKRCNSRAFMRP